MYSPICILKQRTEKDTKETEGVEEKEMDLHEPKKVDEIEREKEDNKVCFSRMKPDNILYCVLFVHSTLLTDLNETRHHSYKK